MFHKVWGISWVAAYTTGDLSVSAQSRKVGWLVSKFVCLFVCLSVCLLLGLIIIIIIIIVIIIII
jgi:hypothetical protein